ncbi:MAG TPA: glycosyltransferase family 39 protein [Solirubrobacteraceae bacterium]|jgi:4-amino-4-deoxy-L-arabinose transferase-like glycosyltransferase
MSAIESRLRPNKEPPPTGRADKYAGAGRLITPAAGALTAVLALSGLLEFVRLSQNGFANIYYSAAVKSMLRSWHNFLFVSADPNGLITVDKPPLALWLQAASAKLFGFTPLSLLIPEGVCAVVAVALLYRLVAPRFGTLAGLASALSLSVFPSFVAVGRDNGVDPLLIVLMLASCLAGLAAIESGRLRDLVWCAVLAGLAFETKSFAALLVVPGIAAGYAICGPGLARRRVGELIVAGVVLGAVAAAWPLFVDLTPASQRPFVGGSGASNSELQLDFGYNGFGRVAGESGGPGTKHTLTPAELFPLVRPAVTVPPTPAEERYFSTHKRQQAPPAPVHPPAGAKRSRATIPVPFAGARGPLRIFGDALGDQAGWDVPFALAGLLALALAIRRRRDRCTAALLVLGGWMVAELVVLDFSNGIVHPYYASALAPGLAAMVGAGAATLWTLMRRARGRQAIAALVLAVAAIGGTLAVQLLLIAREGEPLWWRIPLVALSIAAVIALLFARSRRGWVLAFAVAFVLVAPAAYSTSVWLAPVNGTFPTAGAYSDAGYGGVGVDHAGLMADRSLIRYLRHHGATDPYPLLAETSVPAAPLILLGLQASSEGGYGASDQALTAADLAALVGAGEARYVLLEGPFALRTGNSAAVAARLVCTEIPEIIWGTSGTGSQSLLLDCAGKAAQLRHPYRTARAFLRAHPQVHYTIVRAQTS